MDRKCKRSCSRKKKMQTVYINVEHTGLVTQYTIFLYSNKPIDLAKHCNSKDSELYCLFFPKVLNVFWTLPKTAFTIDRHFPTTFLPNKSKTLLQTLFLVLYYKKKPLPIHSDHQLATKESKSRLSFLKHQLLLLVCVSIIIINISFVMDCSSPLDISLNLNTNSFDSNFPAKLPVSPVFT